MNNDFKNTGMGRNFPAVQCTVTAEDPLSHTVQPKRKRKNIYIYIHTQIYIVTVEKSNLIPGFR